MHRAINKIMCMIYSQNQTKCAHWECNGYDDLANCHKIRSPHQPCDIQVYTKYTVMGSLVRVTESLSTAEFGLHPTYRRIKTTHTSNPNIYIYI